MSIANISILNGVGDGGLDGTDTFSGNLSGNLGQILASDFNPSSVYKSELEGLNVNTAIVLQANGNITTQASLTAINFVGSGNISFVANFNNSGGVYAGASTTLNAAGRNIFISGAQISAGSINTFFQSDTGGTTGNGGAITLNSTGNIISTASINSYTSSSVGTGFLEGGMSQSENGGAIALNSAGDIYTASINSFSFSFSYGENGAPFSQSGNGGAISLNSLGDINTAFIKSFSRAISSSLLDYSFPASPISGNGGAIYLNSGGNINTASIDSYSASGLSKNGGAIYLNSDGNINTDSINSSSSSFAYLDSISEDGGTITLNCIGNINTDSIDSSSSSYTPSGVIAGLGNGGAVNFNATSININGSIFTYSATTDNGTVGNGGNINLSATSNLNIKAINNFNIIGRGNVNYGNITLTGNEINLTGGINRVRGDGKNIILQSFSAGQAIQIGSADSGNSSILDITNTDLTAISTGYNQITIGRSNSSGDISINTGAFTSPVIFRTPTGQININAAISGNLGFIAAGINILGTGTLTLGKSAEIIDTANLILKGGNFNLNGFNETANQLKLTTNSTIDFGNSRSDLVFSNSSSQIWTGILTINNWQVSTGETLRFGTNSTGLTASQLSKIKFTGFNAGAKIDNLGFITPINFIQGSGILIGTNNNDTIIGGTGNDTLTGKLGDDNLNGAGGTDTVKESGDVTFRLTNTELTGLGTDTLISIESANLTGGVGNNTLNALNFTLGSVTLNGLGGNDVLIGGSKNDTLNGGDGNDTLAGKLGNDIINGGNGIDIVTERSDVNFRLTNTELTGLGTDTLISIESANLTGGVGNNTLNALNFTLGSVTLNGDAGNDLLIGGSQNDFLNGGDGNDTLSGKLGNDIINGGNGTDIVTEKADVNFTLTNTNLFGLGTDTLISIESSVLTGGIGNNTLNAINFTLGSVTLNGDAGNDLLIGGSQNDFLNGGDGNDTLAAKVGNDTVNGGNGTDIVTERADVNFTLTNSTLTGLGTDTLISIESSVLTGGVGNNSFNALAFTLGSVTQNGDAGNDVLRGGFKNDFLFGGDGNDVLRGAGNNNGVGSIDTLTGNAGNDTFILSDSTTAFYNDGNNASSGLGDYALIKDFSSTFDKIQLEGVANLYVLGVSPIVGVTGTAIYKDTNSNGIFNSTDELIAIAQGDVGSSCFIYV